MHPEDIKVIMEETGVEESQARDVLASRGNIQSAIRSLKGVVKQFGIVKCKFRSITGCHYGLAISVVDIRKGTVVRLSSVIGDDPTIYETDISQSWLSLQRETYLRRLKIGVNYEETSRFEQALDTVLLCAGITLWHNTDDEVCKRLEKMIENCIRDSIHLDKPVMKIQYTTLTIGRYLEILGEKVSTDSPTQEQGRRKNASFPALRIHVAEPGQMGKSGYLKSSSRLLSRVRPGDTVLVSITDERELGRYVANLLGGDSEQNRPILPSRVESIRPYESVIHLKVRLAPGVIGESTLPIDTRVLIARNKASFTYFGKWGIIFGIAAAGLLLTWFLLSVR